MWGRAAIRCKPDGRSSSLCRPAPQSFDTSAASPVRRANAAAEVVLLLFAWLPYLPASSKAEAERVEREIVAAARRLGVGRGPHELPESADELARRRRRRAG
jgi:hypothetical protein